MKNRQSCILLSVTGLFLAFILGFLLGRTTQSSGVQISSLPETAPTEAMQVSALSASPTEEEATVNTIALSGETDPGDGAQSSVPSEPDGSGELININTATLSQLDSLPGIGEVLAQRIIDYRQTHGPFTSVSQLTMVEGIGSKRLAAILDLITAE